MGNKNGLEIGLRIARLRDKYNLSQNQLAAKLNENGLLEKTVTREMVTRWENGDRDLKTEYTIALAELFGVSTDFILRGNEARNVNAHEKTGLSDKALDRLEVLAKHSATTGNANTLDAVSCMIECDSFITFILRLEISLERYRELYEHKKNFVAVYKEYFGVTPGDVSLTVDRVLRAVHNWDPNARVHTAEEGAANGLDSRLRDEARTVKELTNQTDYEVYLLSRDVEKIVSECVEEVKANG